MKTSQMQSCIDFIRFNKEAEGFSMESEEEDLLKEILDEELNASDAIADVIKTMDLDTAYVDVPEMYYEDTGCLVNFFNIRDKKALKEVENRIVPIRMAQILAQDLPASFNFDTLCTLHSNLFSDIFPSAGCLRTEEAAKRTVFCQPQYIEQMAQSIFDKLRDDSYLYGKDRESFINDFAFYMGEVEALHPFLDGNGRTARLFFYQIALRAGYDFNWFEMDHDRLTEADICAIDGEYQLLIDVVSEFLIP
ncbi:MAG: Fic family protein [Sphaerochaetaceae bacterium]